MLRSIIRRGWYLVFNAPPRVLAGRAIRSVVSHDTYESAVSGQVCKTEKPSGISGRIEMLLAGVEDYEFSQNPDAARSRSFWSGAGGNRWNLTRFRQRGDEYKEAYARCLETMRPLIEARDISRIIEIGCGNGQALAYFSEHLPSYISLHGVDINPDTVTEAQQLARQGVQIHCGNVLEYLDGDLSNTLIIARYVLMYFANDDLRALLGTIKNGGGNIYIYDKTYDYLEDSEETRYGSMYRWSHNYPLLLKQHGLSVKTDHSEHANVGRGGFVYRLAAIPSQTAQQARSAN